MFAYSTIAQDFIAPPKQRRSFSSLSSSLRAELAVIAAVENHPLSLQRVRQAPNKRSANDCFLTPGSRNHSRFS